MTLEEIKQMSVDELNLELSVLAFGFQKLEKGKFVAVERIPDEIPVFYTFEQLPQFCSDLNVIARVEKIFREKALNEDSDIFGRYGETLFRQAINYYPSDSPVQSKEPIDYAMVATLSARERAEACLLVLQRQ